MPDQDFFLGLAYIEPRVKPFLPRSRVKTGSEPSGGSQEASVLRPLRGSHLSVDRTSQQMDSQKAVCEHIWFGYRIHLRCIKLIYNMLI